MSNLVSAPSPMAIGDMHTQHSKRYFLLCILLPLSVLLTSCGGSGSQNHLSVGTSNTNSEATSEIEETSENPETTTAVQFAPADISLNWQIPLSREDGSALPINAIAGYEINYTNSRHQSTVITLNDAASNSYKINDLPADDYRFTVFAFDTDNAISDPSPLAIIQRRDFPRL